MSDRSLPHIHVVGAVWEVDGFEERRSFPDDQESTRFPTANREAHARKLQSELSQAIRAVDSNESGVRINFQSFPDTDLFLNSFESRTTGDQPRLDTVRRQIVNGAEVEVATVYVPPKKRSYFIRKVEEYSNSLEGEGNPKNRNIVERVESIRRAFIEDLWSDPPHLLPPPMDQVWWEVWLRDPNRTALQRLRDSTNDLKDVRLGTLALGFDSQLVVLLRARLSELRVLDTVLDNIVELRKPAERIEFIATEPARVQGEWLDSLIGRILDGRNETSPAVCVLDQMVNRSHPLIAPFLRESNVYLAIPEWSRGADNTHGTEMAALALYEDLGASLASSGPVQIDHALEFVKVFPTQHDLELETPILYGAVIARAVDAVELVDPERNRVYSLAVTAPHDDPDRKTEPSYLGNPTSWSASIDGLAAGRQIDTSADSFLLLEREAVARPRLFVVSAGNVRDLALHRNYPDQNDIESIEDPGQAWNALTVGAFTERSQTSSEGWHCDWIPVAARGGLSPLSRTSIAFETDKWPVKPDVVAEGGNTAFSPSGPDVDTPEELSVITAAHHWELRGPFSVTRGTSAATSSVAAIAADVCAEYPQLWPESIRALVVHSADWTPAMMQEFNRARTKDQRKGLHRKYGMGVPSALKARKSARDSLTLVSQEYIQPYKWSPKQPNSNDGIYAGVNLHTLPWPTEELESLGARPVKLRVTLSYFVEPNPSARGWKGRYVYPSHGLRFRVKEPLETTLEFNKRINRTATADGEAPPSSSESSDRWWFGSLHQRGPGSLHTDIWTGSAADLGSKNVIAVYPVAGWWKTQMRGEHLGASQVRYCLIVSIEAEGAEIDLWTPVANFVELEV